MILVTCKDEKHQLALLRKWKKEGIACQAKIS
jgi:hypothetical protein